MSERAGRPVPPTDPQYKYLVSRGKLNVYTQEEVDSLVHPELHAASHAHDGADNMLSEVVGALSIILGAATTAGIRLNVTGGIFTIREGDNSGPASISALQVICDTVTAATMSVSTALNLTGKLTAAPTTSANIDANDEIATPTSLNLDVTCSGASDNLDGIGAGTDGQIVFIRPAAGKDITLVHNGTVTTGKKLMINGEANVTLDQDHDIAIAIYRAATQVWHVMVPGSGGGGGSSDPPVFLLPLDTTGEVGTGVSVGFAPWPFTTTSSNYKVMAYSESAVDTTQTYEVFADGSSLGTVTIPTSSPGPNRGNLSTWQTTLQQHVRYTVKHPSGNSSGVRIVLAFVRQ